MRKTTENSNRGTFKKKRKEKEKKNKSWQELLKTFKAIKNKESLRNYHSFEEPKEKCWLNAMWYPGWSHGTEREHWVDS